jgi:signal peptidase I
MRVTLPIDDSQLTYGDRTVHMYAKVVVVAKQGKKRSIVNTIYVKLGDVVVDFPPGGLTNIQMEGVIVPEDEPL